MRVRTGDISENSYQQLVHEYYNIPYLNYLRAT